MTLIHHNIKKLEEVNGLLLQLSQNIYTTERETLSGASIGQHFRHILEFYICLEKGNKIGIVSYDERERNVLMETDLLFAVKSIGMLIQFLSSLKNDCVLTMKANYSNSNEGTTMQTSLYRELAYALDHTVHHLAIIKIALSEEEKSLHLDSNFGVAPSTIRYREQCAQ
jgi:hypothetical protein